MSLRAMSWAWEQETKSSGERLVLLALADHAGEDGECWPHSARLGEKCGLDRKTVQRHLTALDERGVIEKVSRRKRNNGTLAGWLYRLPIVEGTHTSRLGGDTDIPTKRGHAHPVLEDTPTSPQEPSIFNPQIEPSQVDNDWQTFWNEYPRKTGKQNAEKAWSKLSATDRQSALAQIDMHIHHWDVSGTSPQFIPHPATWLNGRRWEDELPTIKSKNTAPGMDAVKRILEGIQDAG